MYIVYGILPRLRTAAEEASCSYTKEISLKSDMEIQNTDLEMIVFNM